MDSLTHFLDGPSISFYDISGDIRVQGDREGPAGLSYLEGVGEDAPLKDFIFPFFLRGDDENRFLNGPR